MPPRPSRGSSAPAPSPAPEDGRHERATQVRCKRSQLADAKTRARDAVCVGPKYPGSPRDYTYVLQEYCRPRDPAARAQQRRRSKGDDRYNNSSTDREIRAIKKALESTGPTIDPSLSKYSTEKIPRTAIPYIDWVFALMINPESRAATPDPLIRYDKIVHDVTRNDDSVATSDVPRVLLLRMVVLHLVANKKMYGF